MKLADTEKEAEKARKDSKVARDNFNDLKKRRFEPTPVLVEKEILTRLPDAICSTKPITTYPTASIRCIRN